MATQTTIPAANAQATPSKPKRTPRSHSVNFEDAKGARLEVRMEVRKDGSYRTYVRHITVSGTGKAKKRAITKGATASHSSEAEARKAWEAAQVAVAAAGWSRKARRGGFASRPDAFGLDSLPKPSKK